MCLVKAQSGMSNAQRNNFVFLQYLSSTLNGEATANERYKM
jgi:hypothetical protein